jgi:hypothetical protein
MKTQVMKEIRKGVFAPVVIEEPQKEELEEMEQSTYRERVFNRIMTLKDKLKATDYKAIKYAEGLISEEDYSTIKAQRQAWRDEINALQTELQKS